LCYGNQSPFQKGGRAPSPIFGPRLLWPNGWMGQDGTWHEGGPWCRSHFARWGPNSPLPKKGGGRAPSQFSAHFYCSQTAGCIKMALGMELGLSLGDCVRWGPRPFPNNRAWSPAIFGPCLLWPNGWMDQDSTWYGGRTRPGGIVLDGDPAPPLLKGHIPQFSANVRWPNGWMD